MYKKVIDTAKEIWASDSFIVKGKTKTIKENNLTFELNWGLAEAKDPTSKYMGFKVTTNDDIDIASVDETFSFSDFEKKFNASINSAKNDKKYKEYFVESFSNFNQYIANYILE